MENLCHVALLGGMVGLLYWLVKQFTSFYNELVKNVGKNKVFAMHLADFYPRKIRRQLQNATRINENTKIHLWESYNRLLVKIVKYIAFTLIHIAFALYRIAQVIKNYLCLKGTNEFTFIIGFICLSIAASYCCLIAPIRILLGTDSFEKCKNDVFEFFKRIFFDIVAFGLSFIFCKLWVDWAEKFVKPLNKEEISLWTELAILMLYQYLFLFFISGFIHLIISVIDMILKRFLRKKSQKNIIDNGFVRIVSYCKRYADKSLIYPVLKNCTYLVFVMVYALAVEAGPNGEVVAGATGILFLADTFLDKDIEIGKKLSDDSKK